MKVSQCRAAGSAYSKGIAGTHAARNVPDQYDVSERAPSLFSDMESELVILPVPKGSDTVTNKKGMSPTPSSLLLVSPAGKLKKRSTLLSQGLLGLLSILVRFFLVDKNTKSTQEAIDLWWTSLLLGQARSAALILATVSRLLNFNMHYLVIRFNVEITY